MKLDSKLGADKQPVWGFVITDEAAKTPATPLRVDGWEPNATGGVDATPWNLWEVPDDAIEIRTTTSF